MYVIALIGIGLVLHGFIMLAFAAFRARPAWGLAVLFLPFAQLFFPIYHWDQARKPFMTFTFGMSLWLGTAIVFGQGPLDEYWLNKVGPVQSAEQTEHRQKPLSLQERAERLISSAKAVVTPQFVKSHQKKVFNVVNSPDYIGKNVRVALHNGNVRNGRINSASNGMLELQYTIGKKTIGSMTYELTYDEIKSIEIID
ncbi:MAG: hypothetical protein AMJ53_07580 [Gammaproteobacteria bacterium SG8_11]|nr:MAG: hypothetical protein AMJ53_07580 [Gammaproteobacteria bacterium SG8_11]